MSVLTWLMDQWWRFTAPPQSNTHLKIISQQRNASSVMLIIILLLVMSFIGEPSAPLAMVLACVGILDLIGLFFFNRRGKTVAAGLLLTGVTELGILLGLYRLQISNGHMNMFGVYHLVILVQPLVIAVSVLPFRYAVGLFLLNCGVTWYWIATASQSFGSFSALFTIPLLCYTVGLLVPYNWVRVYTTTQMSAHLADERAAVEKALNERNELEKQRIEQMLFNLLLVIQQIADHPEQPFLQEREESSPFDIVFSTLNLLRERLNSLQDSQKQYEMVYTATVDLMHFLNKKEEFQWTPTGTPVDGVVMALQNAKQNTNRVRK